MAIMAIIYVLSSFEVPLNISEMSFEKLAGEIHLYSGKVVEVKQTDEKINLKIRIRSIDNVQKRLHGYVLVNYYNSIDDPASLMNATIDFIANFSLPNTQRNPHCFNYRNYLKSKKIFLTTSLKTYEILDDVKLNLIERYERALYRAKYEYSSVLSNRSKGVIFGVLFGDTSAMDDDIYNQFRTNGTCHVLAVSGLHIGILYSLYRKVFKKRNNALSLCILGILLFSYGTLSMWSPSTIRAELMIAMNVLAFELDLRYDLLTAMSAVGLLLIAFNPYVILGTSFQMSFLAIASLAFIRPVLPKKLPDGMRTTLAVNIGILGYQMFNFNYISLTALIANIPVVFLASYLVPIALIGFAIFCLFGITFPMVTITEAMAVLLEKVNGFTTINGLGAFQVKSPDIPIVLFLSFMLFFFCSEYFEIVRLRNAKHRLKQVVVLSTVMSVFLGVIYFSPITYDDLVFIDVGQGDSTHIRLGNTNILIDGGGSLDYNIGESILKPYLLHNGVNDVDLVLMTHLHTDHYQGILELAEKYKVKDIKTGLKAGNTIKVKENLTITTIWPLIYDVKSDKKDENSNCSVFIVHYNGYKIMITGDLDEEGERGIIETYSDELLKCDILKVGHHGSRFSSSDAFLDVVSPTYAVIQVGKNNYGHPTKETLDRLTAHGAIVLRNDLDGAIGFRFKPNRIVYHTLIN